MSDASMKSCTKCHVPKPETEFYYRNDTQRRIGQCKTCCRAKVTAGRSSEKRKAYREANKLKISRYMAAYRSENREKILKQRETYRRLCETKVKESARRYNWSLKMKLLNHYGKACICCGETELYFLQIDHINGGGTKHRRSLRDIGGSNFYMWLIKQGFPEGYRVLCANCNGAIGHYGFCPHQVNVERLREFSEGANYLKRQQHKKVEVGGSTGDSNEWIC